jgi:hypothetical protein
MQLRIDRHTLLIVPESDQDIAFLEDTLKMREDGDVIKFERIDDETQNWIKFKLESFSQTIKDNDDYYSEKTPSRRVQERSRKFKNILDENDVSERVTLVDIEEIE